MSEGKPKMKKVLGQFFTTPLENIDEITTYLNSIDFRKTLESFGLTTGVK